MERGNSSATYNAYAIATDSTDSTVTDACSKHLAGATMMHIRQRRKWPCNTKIEFKYFNAERGQVAHSIEDTDCLCRMCCPYVVVVVFVAVYCYSIVECCCFAIDCV